MFITKSFFRGGAGLRIVRNALNRVGHRALRIFPPDSIASQTPGPFQTFGPVRSHPKTFWEHEGMKPSKHREAPHTHGPLDHHSAATQHVRRLRTSLPTANPVQSPLVHSPRNLYPLLRRPTPRTPPSSPGRHPAHLLPIHGLSFTSSPRGFSPPAAATRYKEARNSISLAVARPRWLMLFFSSSGISAKVSSYPSGRNTGS